MIKRRTFLKQGATLGIAAVGGFPLAMRGASVDEQRPAFHTRHIPIEHLNLSAPTGQEVVRNGLCDTIKPDVLKRLKEEFGVELVEMRCVWWEIEPEQGRFDWSRVLRDTDAVLNAGLKVGLFPWFQYPPGWYDPEHKSHARYRTVDGKKESTVLSLWDPQTLEVYDRLMGLTAEALKGRISFVYNGISGSYGEVDCSVSMQHYRFSSPAGGYLVGDRCARASFVEALRQKYDSVGALNQAWGTDLTSFESVVPPFPFKEGSLRSRDDCMQWATRSLLDFTDRACGLYAKHFPGIKGGLPMGYVTEKMFSCQIKSLAAKMAAKHGLTARWTGTSHLGSFDRSHLLARRIATAAHFYGAPYGTEASLILEASVAANGLYESLANGTSLIHDDPQNIFRAADVHRRIRPQLIVDPPVTSAALFFPFEDQILDIDSLDWETFVDRCASCRRILDYDVCDSYLIADGFLKTKRDLILVGPCAMREATAQAIVDFARTGGRVWLYGDVDAKILYAGGTLTDLARQKGVAVHAAGADAGKGGSFFCFTDWKQLAKFGGNYETAGGGSECFRTIHRRHESWFIPHEGVIGIEPRSDNVLFNTSGTKRTRVRQ